jgi:hypothetical protein
MLALPKLWGHRARLGDRIAELIVENLAPVSQAGALPPIFWMDPYVVGFHYAQVETLVRIAATRRITERRNAQLISHILTRISGRDGQEFLSLALRYLRQGDLEYLAGERLGELVARQLLGAPLEEDASAPEVMAARRYAKARHGEPTEDELNAVLVEIAMTDPLRARLAKLGRM